MKKAHGTSPGIVHGGRDNIMSRYIQVRGHGNDNKDSKDENDNNQFQQKTWNQVTPNASKVIRANNEGIWNSYHMSLQFEDVVDCLMVLYPEFEFVFLFDNSQGHARKRHGALSALQMS